MAIDIRFYGDADGPKVATKAMGRGKIHLVQDGDTLCGQGVDGMATGRVIGEMDWDHSDLCKRCLQQRD